MKISKLAVFTALTCCAAFKPCSAQMPVIGNHSFANGNSPAATNQVLPAAYSDDPLVSPTDLFASPEEAVPQAPGANESATPVVNEAPSLTNPFDSFGTGPFGTGPFATGPNQRPTAQAIGSENAPVPHGLPTERHDRQPAGHKSMAETILQYGAYQDIPNASYMPVQWPNMHGTVDPMNSTNSIGHYMLRNWCVGDLWSSYPAQRAAQCQAIQNSIAGCAHYRCNRYLLHGGQHVCSQTAASPCSNASRCGHATSNICSGAAAKAAVALPVPPAIAAPEEQVLVAPVSVQLPTLAEPFDPQPTEDSPSTERNVVAQLPAYIPPQQLR